MPELRQTGEEALVEIVQRVVQMLQKWMVVKGQKRMPEAGSEVADWAVANVVSRTDPKSKGAAIRLKLIKNRRCLGYLQQVCKYTHYMQHGVIAQTPLNKEFHGSAAAGVSLGCLTST